MDQVQKSVTQDDIDMYYEAWDNFDENGQFLNDVSFLTYLHAAKTKKSTLNLTAQRIKIINNN